MQPTSNFLPFLVAPTYLYKWVCPSVHLSIHRSILPPIRRSITASLKRVLGTSFCQYPPYFTFSCQIRHFCSFFLFGGQCMCPHDPPLHIHGNVHYRAWFGTQFDGVVERNVLFFSFFDYQKHGTRYACTICAGPCATPLPQAVCHIHCIAHTWYHISLILPKKILGKA